MTICRSLLAVIACTGLAFMISVAHGQKASSRSKKRPSAASAIADVSPKASNTINGFGNADGDADSAPPWSVNVHSRASIENGQGRLYEQIARRLSLHTEMPADRSSYFAALVRPPHMMPYGWSGSLTKVESVGTGGHVATVLITPGVWTPTGVGRICHDYSERYYIDADGNVEFLDAHASTPLVGGHRPFITLF